MARAKHTARSEARRRYRLETRSVEVDDELEDGDEAGAMADEAQASTSTRSTVRPAAARGAKSQPAPSGRPGIMASLRGAYHPPHIREDLAALPSILSNWAFLAAIAAVAVTAGAFVAFPGYNGSTLAWDNIVIPGNGVLTPLFVGFFAKRGSYILGFLIGLVQAIAYLVSVSLAVASLGTGIDSTQVPNLIVVSLFSGSVSGLAFASASAWYRRFLALSSPRRPVGQRSTANRGKTQARASGRR